MGIAYTLAVVDRGTVRHVQQAFQRQYLCHRPNGTAAGLLTGGPISTFTEVTRPDASATTSGTTVPASVHGSVFINDVFSYRYLAKHRAPLPHISAREPSGYKITKPDIMILILRILHKNDAVRSTCRNAGRTVLPAADTAWRAFNGPRPGHHMTTKSLPIPCIFEKSI